MGGGRGGGGGSPPGRDHILGLCRDNGRANGTYYLGFRV